MRVMCIKEHDAPASGCEHFPRPQVGSEYFVIREGIVCGDLFYALAGFDYNWAYLASHFAVVSLCDNEICEEEKETMPC